MVTRLTISLDDDVHRAVKSTAEAQRRSIASLINWMLATQMGLQIRPPRQDEDDE